MIGKHFDPKIVKVKNAKTPQLNENASYKGSGHF